VKNLLTILKWTPNCKFFIAEEKSGFMHAPTYAMHGHAVQVHAARATSSIPTS
jgi:hypothetical protein